VKCTYVSVQGDTHGFITCCSTCSPCEVLHRLHWLCTTSYPRHNVEDIRS